MKIQRATHLGMCFGVRDAIGLATEHSRQAPLTILGDLVHNPTVIESLRRRGVLFERRASEIPTKDVMITAHGASEKTIAGLRERGLRVVEATCPLVHFAHRSLGQLVGQGFHPVIIGRAGHVEVRGLTEDLPSFDVVLTEADVDGLPEHPRIGVIAQTTHPIGHVHLLVRRMRSRFPCSEVRFIDTVCQPTKQRQDAAVALARTSEVVIVIGGASSNNTRQLAATCRQHCARVHHVEAPRELQAEWFEEVERIGLTAGTSTPDALIDAVETRIREMAAVCSPLLA